MDQLHLEATWIPGGVHVESRWILNKIMGWSLFWWSPDGVQMDLWSPCGVHMESVGECKVQWFTHYLYSLSHHLELYFLDYL